jgi:fructose-1-phosphate kinase PfkB-like protein
MKPAPRRLLTLTGNPLAEYTGDYPAWPAGGTARARYQSFQVGGKGLNVAKLYHRLGGTVTAATFVGGLEGEICRAWLQDHAAYALHLIPTTTPTRLGWVVRAPDQAETTFLGPDGAPDPDALAACADFLRALPADTAVALCGSFPGWTDPAAAPLRAALHQLAHDGRLVIDTYGAPLAELTALPLPLVKINRTEFAALSGTTIRPDGEADSSEELAAWAADHPVLTWIVTDGPRPTLIWQREQSPVSLPSPPVPVVSPTGSGDVLLAALLYFHWYDDLPWAEALRRAIPLAAANTASAGIADFPLAND